jgi:alanine dehydrogenase
MIIGVPKEIKTREYRVGLTPQCVKEYTRAGHTVIIQSMAGFEAGFEDSDYVNAGGKIMGSAEEIFATAQMIIKVKEPQESEFKLFKKGHILYTYLHLASSAKVTDAMLKSGVTSYAYEMIKDANGGFPCLAPMSAIAGKLSIQQAAKYLEKSYGGRGILMGGVPGVERAKVAIIGGGVVGSNAAKVANGMGAEVSMLDINTQTLQEYDREYGTQIKTMYSNNENIETIVRESDVIIGAVLLPGMKAPHLIKKDHLKYMKKGSILVDVAVDQGGCFETTKATSYDDPIYTIDGILHFCVANLPGAVPLTSTKALTQQTLKYGLKIASKTFEECNEIPEIHSALSTHNHELYCEEVAHSLGYTLKTT